MPVAAPPTPKAFADQSQQLLASGVTIRNDFLCVLWLLLALLALATISLGAIAAGATLALFGLHGLVAEALGLKIDSKGIVAPRRLSASLPFLVLWRQRIPLASISNVTSMPGSWAGERAIVVANSVKRTNVLFQNREKRLYFLQLLTQLRPSLNIRRSR
jgi:hypothetical protein